MTSTTNMSRDHTFVHSTFLQTATGKGIAGQYLLYISMVGGKVMADMTKTTINFFRNLLSLITTGACVWAAIAITCHQIYQYLRYLTFYQYFRYLTFLPVLQVSHFFDQYLR